MGIVFLEMVLIGKFVVGVVVVFLFWVGFLYGGLFVVFC